MWVATERGFSLPQWREMSQEDREIEILFFQMKNEYEMEQAKKRQAKKG